MIWTVGLRRSLTNGVRQQIKSQMKHQFKRIEQLQTQKQETSSVAGLLEPRNELEDVIRELQKEFCSLGVSLVREQRVPGFPRSTSPASSPVALQIPRAAPRIASATIGTLRQDTQSPPSGRTDLRTTRRHLRPNSKHQPARTSTMNAEDSDIVMSGALAHPTDTANHFLSVYRSQNLVTIDNSMSYEIQSGFLRTSKGFPSVNARVYEDFNENFVTQDFAVRHRIHVELPDSADQDDSVLPSIRIGRGKAEQCIGKATVRWCRSDREGGRDFPVHCFVCVHSVADVVLGLNFSNKMESYQHRSRLV